MLIAICGFAALGGGVIIASALLRSWRDDMLAIAGAFLLVLGGAGLLGTFAWQASLPAKDKSYETTNSVKLASLSNASEIEGRGSALYVRVGEKNVYRYVEAHHDGSYTLEETDEALPIREDATASTSRIDTVVCAWNDQITSMMLGNCGVVTTIHVPKGSVSRDFSIDPAS